MATLLIYEMKIESGSWLSQPPFGQTVKIGRLASHWINETYVPDGEERSHNILRLAATDVPALLNTLSINLEEGSPEKRLYQRKVFNFSLKPEYKEEFKKLSADKAQLLLEELHEWLVERQVADDEQDKKEYVSFNVFYSDHFPSERQEGDS